MRLGWGARQILALLVLAVILVTISVVLELISVIQLAIEGATTEGALISQTLFLQIQHLVGETTHPPIEAIREDPRIDLILQAAVAQSPSVAFVAITDSSGRAVVHTTADRIGTRLDSIPPLPESRGIVQTLSLLPSLARPPEVYGLSTPLLLGETPFATIRVGIAVVLLQERVREVLRHGLITAGILIALAAGLGFLLARIASKRIRLLEEGIAAMREGRFESRIPESGLDEFGRLARDLNLLSEQFQRERESRDSTLGPIRQTVELLGEGVLTLDPDRRVVLANGPAGRILGIEASEARGRLLDDLLAESHPVRILIRRLFEEKVRSLTASLPRQEDEPAYVAIGHRITGTDSTGGALIEFKESAALAELHSLVDHSRVLSRLGQMAAGVAHEIRNPLQTINLELGILRQSGNLSPQEVNEHVRTATDEIERLQRAVSGFLKVARLRGLNHAMMPVDQLLEETHRAMEGEANLSGLDLDLDLAPDLPRVSGDRDVLRQAVENLVKNAIQALPSRSGTVTLAGRCGEKGEILISVADTGPGIPPEHLEKVSDLYFTTKKTGTGVGLALVRQAVELHGGKVEIDSTVGVGTTVTLRIPVGPIGRSDR